MATLHSDLPSLTKVNRSTYFLAILLAIFLQVVTAGQAFGDGSHGGASVSGEPQYSCDTRESMIAGIREGGGRLLGGGPHALSDAFLEVFVNPDTRNWIVIATNPKGSSCVVLYGQDWGKGV